MISASVSSEVLNYSESFDKSDYDQGSSKHGIHLVQILILNCEYLVLNIHLLILNIDKRGDMDFDFPIGILHQSSIEELNLNDRRVISRYEPLEGLNGFGLKGQGLKNTCVSIRVRIRKPRSHRYSTNESFARL